MKYPEYLKTAHFLNLKKKTLKRWGNKCALCSSPKDLHIHHNCYVWFEEKETDVIPLCGKCHDKFHDIEIHPLGKHKNDAHALVLGAIDIVNKWEYDG